ncbi:CRAL/TRIO, N-terminal domain [Musa troglodytarum]|nr:CRAL/TRIO, N-terminal domain [Musa troglodytarum]
MAEETETKAHEAPPAAEVVVAETEEKKPEAEEAVPPADEAAATVPESTSLEEESNVVAEPVDPQKRALDELKQLVQAALSNNEFNPPPPPPAPEKEELPVEEEEAKHADASAPASVEESKPPSETVSAQEAKPAEAPAPASVEVPKPRSEPVPAPAERSLEPEVVEEHASPVNKEPLPPPSQPAEEKAAAADDATAKTVKTIEEAVGPAAAEDVSPAPTAPPEEVFIWGVPLVGDEKTDAVLLKFLRARDFKVKDALAMLKDAVIWRKQFGIEALLEEDLGLPELDKVVFMHGNDKEGHPVCYNVYGEFQNKERYEKAFGDTDKRRKFLKWRIQYLEKGIMEHLHFTPGGISSMVQVTDLRNSPRLGKHRQVTKQAVTLLQDNYPEFISKKVFINVPWWYLAVNRMMSPFFTQRTKSKFVFAGPSKSAETLFKYIAPEQVPVAFGGLSKAKDPDFSTADVVTDVSIKPSSKQTIEIPATETCLVVWELRVLGCEVSYGAEFTPSAADGYTVIVQKNRKLAADDEPVIKGSFKNGEPGKVFLNIENLTSKKKLVLYRYKVKSSTGST